MPKLPRTPHAPLSLDAVAIFVEVVRAKSFSAAARRLGVPKSTVSVRIAELESRLGVALLHRTTRKVSATPAGEAYFVIAARTISDLREAELAAAHAQSEPSGTLRITSAGHETGQVGARIAEFLALHPQVSIELILTSHKVDLLAENVDVAFRIGQVGDDPSLTARRIGSVQRALYASAEYLRNHATPTQPRELSAHALLLSAPRTEVVLVRADGGRSTQLLTSRFAAKDPAAQRQQALRGVGIALLPAGIGDEEVKRGALRRVLADWVTPSLPVSLVYAKQRYLPQRVRAFVEHVLAQAQRSSG